MKVFIIPGNPPIKHFYEEWMKELSGELPIKAITSESFPNIDNRDNSHEFLDDMVDFYEQKIIEFSEDEEVIILGHSIGGHFAYEVLKRNPQLVKKCVLLFPFLGRPTLKAKFILNFANLVNNNHTAKKLLFKNVVHLEKVIPELRPATFDELDVCIKLASHEKHTLGKVNVFDEVHKSLVDKLHAFYCPKDDWFSAKAANDLGQYIKCEGIDSRHDFIVNKFHRDLVTAELKKALV